MPPFYGVHCEVTYQLKSVLKSEAVSWIHYKKITKKGPDKF